MRALTTCLLMLVFCSTVGGCYTVHARLPGALRHDVDPHVVVIGSFDHEVTHVYWLDGLLNRPPEELFEAPLLEAVAAAGGDGVANIVLESRFSAADVTLRTVSFSLLAPRTYRMRADIVRINAPALRGQPLLGGTPSPEAR